MGVSVCMREGWMLVANPQALAQVRERYICIYLWYMHVVQ